MFLNLSWAFITALQFCVPFPYVFLLHVVRILTPVLNQYLGHSQKIILSSNLERGGREREVEGIRGVGGVRDGGRRKALAQTGLCPFSLLHTEQIAVCAPDPIYGNLLQSVSIFLPVSVLPPYCDCYLVMKNFFKSLLS